MLIIIMLEAQGEFFWVLNFAAIRSSLSRNPEYPLGCPEYELR